MAVDPAVWRVITPHGDMVIADGCDTVQTHRYQAGTTIVLTRPYHKPRAIASSGGFDEDGEAKLQSFKDQIVSAMVATPFGALIDLRVLQVAASKAHRLSREDSDNGH